MDTSDLASHFLRSMVGNMGKYGQKLGNFTKKSDFEALFDIQLHVYHQT